MHVGSRRIKGQKGVAQGDLIKGRRALGFAFSIPKVSEASWWILGSRLSAPNGLLVSVSDAQGKVPCSGTETGLRNGCQGCEACGLCLWLERAGPQLCGLTAHSGWARSQAH